MAPETDPWEDQDIEIARLWQRAERSETELARLRELSRKALECMDRFALTVIVRAQTPVRALREYLDKQESK